MSTAITTIQVAASADDARNHGYDWPGYANFAAAGILDVGRAGATFYMIGLRFLAVPVPQGATIESASISLYAHASQSESMEATIVGEDADNPATFDSTHSPYSVATSDPTTATVSWTMSGWTADNWYQSSDIKTIIQEIVDRAGWDSGNALCLAIYRTDTESTELPYFRARSYDYTGNTYGAKLDITYAGSSPTGRPMHLLQQVRESRSAQSVRVRSF